MNKFRKSITSIFFLLSSTISAGPWTILFYADPSQSLTDAVVTNINDLAFGLPSSNANIFMQIQTHLDKESENFFSWRYKLTPQVVNIQEKISGITSNREGIVDSVQWAFGNQKSDHYSIILSGHGYGPLYPTLNSNNEWQVELDDAQGACDVRSHIRDMHRAVLVNDITQSYLKADDLAAIAQSASQSTGKKLDLLILDCCLGACIEHAYELSQHVDILIACQNCELVDGIAYLALGNRLSNNFSPEELAHAIVKDYFDYYSTKSKQQVFTLSAINCTKTAQLADILSNIAEVLIEIINENPEAKDIIMQARKECTNFCFMPMLTDLKMLLDAISKRTTQLKSNKVAALNAALSHAQEAFKAAIVANTTGKAMQDKACGLSIYFPYSHVDSSYDNNSFATQTAWGKFLSTMIA